MQYKTGKPAWVKTLALAWDRFKGTECNILVVKAVLLPNHEWIKQQLEKEGALQGNAIEDKKEEPQESREAASKSSEGTEEEAEKATGEKEEKHENGVLPGEKIEEKVGAKGMPEKEEEVPHANGGVESPEPKANGEGSASKKKKNKKHSGK